MHEHGDPHSNYPRSQQPVNGVLILVLGILGVTVCGIFTAIPAWLMGNNALTLIRQGQADPKEEQMANVGRILGMIGTGLTICGCIFYAGMFALGMMGGLKP